MSPTLVGRDGAEVQRHHAVHGPVGITWQWVMAPWAPGPDRSWLNRFLYVWVNRNHGLVELDISHKTPAHIGRTDATDQLRRAVPGSAPGEIARAAFYRLESAW